MEKKSNILIIGGPNSGKTHFGGQLYLRLRSDECRYKITSPPEDLTVFQEVVDCLYNGRSAEHTDSNLHKNLLLEICDESNDKISLSFPDYAGEQVREIVNNRLVNELWKSQILASNSWMLFIRLDEVKKIEDIVNRPLPEELNTEKRENSALEISANAFFVELLQMLLFIKQVSNKQAITTPKLMVVLSCWDTLKLDDGTIPAMVLKEQLPLFYEFTNNIWNEKNLNIVGLSSTGKTLSNKKSDDDYINNSPEDFGYFILPDGKKEKDLTILIDKTIGE